MERSDTCVCWDMRVVGHELGRLVSGGATAVKEVFVLEGETRGVVVVLLEKEPVEMKGPNLGVKARAIVSFLGPLSSLYWAREAWSCGGEGRMSHPSVVSWLVRVLA